MKTQLERELIVALQPYTEDLEAVKMVITIALSKYNVTQDETLPDVWRGDVNEVVLKRFLAAKIAQGCSMRTVKYYKESVMTALQKIGKKYNDVTADDIRAYLAIRVQKDKVAKTTANNERRNLSAFYSWLQREEILLKNPMSKVDVIKETKKKKKAFEQMEIEKIRDQCRTKRETAMVEVLLSTWARVSEVAPIRIGDIQDDHLIVHGKGDKEREVYLNAKAILAVENYLKERTDQNPYLFPKAKHAGRLKQFNRNAEWYKDSELIDETEHCDQGTIENIVRKIGQRAGVENTHPHRFRRTGATMALRSGMPLIQVSKLLGHESIATTQIYLDISDAELAEAHSKYVT